MMAERLAEIRRDLDSEAYTSYLPKTVRELLDHIAQLEAQRGELARELDLTKREAWTAKERHKDEKDRADGLSERLDELSAEDFAKAQRGEFSHVEASARYKALGLPDDVQMHAIFLEGWNGGVQQRGGAVVVPELTDVELSACERLARMCRKSPSLVEGYLDDIKPWEAAEAIEKAAARKAIPADRVLADGMVGVDREELATLREIAGRWCPPFGVPHNMETVALFDRLRTQQAKGK